MSKGRPDFACNHGSSQRIGRAGIGTGIASMVSQNKHYEGLREAIATDIERGEKGISHLKDFWSSLAEVLLPKIEGGWTSSLCNTEGYMQPSKKNTVFIFVLLDFLKS